MNILGLNFYHANASAAVFVDGRLVAAAEEERFNRVKFSAGLPLHSIAFCLRQAGLEFRDVDLIAYPRSTNTRIVNNDQIHYQDRIYRITSLYDRYRMNLKLINFKETLAGHFGVPVESLVFKLREEDHHLSHMRSGFHYSPFEEALLLSCDAFGDFVSLKTAVGRGHDIEVVGEVAFPHSVGLFYTMVTQFLGFRGYGDESKVMGLSTYGYPEFTHRLRTIIHYEPGRIKLDLEYFDTERGVGTSWAEQAPDIGKLFNQNLVRLLGEHREPGAPLEARHQNLAASLQHLTEEVIFTIIEDLYRQHRIPRLVFTGGLAYNSLLNARILEQTDIEELFVPPAPGNSGLALGAPLAYLGEKAPRERMNHSFWGTEYTSGDWDEALHAAGLPFRKVDEPAESAAELLAAGKTVGWFTGRMEFGPRSLGSRCILINPRIPDPARVKQRDLLKPFGVSILREQLGEYFSDEYPSPFMSFMHRIRSRRRREFESVSLNNYCRYQSVGKDNPLLRDVLAAFRRRTGLPLLINTSLNAEGEPIVESPADFLKRLPDLHLDAAVVGEMLLENVP